MNSQKQLYHAKSLDSVRSRIVMSCKKLYCANILLYIVNSVKNLNMNLNKSVFIITGCVVEPLSSFDTAVGVH